MLKALVLSLLVVAIATAAAGCGGGAGDRRQGEAGGDAGRERLSGESEREQCEKRQIPGADRIAYYQLATTAGLVRSNAIATARGLAAPVRAGREDVAAARARVAQLDPHDPGLRRIRRELQPLLVQGARGLRPAQTDRVLEVLSRIDAQLNRYVRRREPAQAALVPD